MREKRAGRRAMMIPVSQLSVILMNLNREACTFPPAKDRDLMTAIHPTLAPSRSLNCWGLGHLTQMPMVTRKYLWHWSIKIFTTATIWNKRCIKFAEQASVIVQWHFSVVDGVRLQPVNIFWINSSWVESAAPRIKAGWNVGLASGQNIL